MNSVMVKIADTILKNRRAVSIIFFGSVWSFSAVAVVLHLGGGFGGREWFLCTLGSGVSSFLASIAFSIIGWRHFLSLAFPVIITGIALAVATEHPGELERRVGFFLSVSLSSFSIAWAASQLGWVLVNRIKWGNIIEWIASAWAEALEFLSRGGEGDAGAGKLRLKTGEEGERGSLFRKEHERFGGGKE